MTAHTTLSSSPALHGDAHDQAACLATRAAAGEDKRPASSTGRLADQLLPELLLSQPRLHPNDPPEVLEFLEAGMTPTQVATERARLAQERAA